jgi:hypothetical protein
MPKSILRRLKIEQTPLLDGNIATFVWKGESAPNLVGDFTGWDAGEPIVMEKSAHGVWTSQVRLPLDAYIEYGYLQNEESLPDPFNLRRTSNGMGGYNHYFQMPEYKSTSLAGKRSAVSHGSITKHVISTDNFVFGSKRPIYLISLPWLSLCH